MSAMHWIKLLIVTFGTVMAMGHCLGAQELKGDAAAGRQFAETWCAGCHTIEGNAARAGDAGPAFASVAKRRSTTRSKLIRFLYSQHKVMPLFEIELDDATNVATYIMTLRRR